MEVLITTGLKRKLQNMKVDKRNCNKKYVMIVTSEDERYRRTVQLGFFADSPWQGRFECCIDGDNFRELSEEIEKADVEGLFYQLYENEDGKSYWLWSCGL